MCGTWLLCEGGYMWGYVVLNGGEWCRLLSGCQNIEACSVETYDLSMAFLCLSKASILTFASLTAARPIMQPCHSDCVKHALSVTVLSCLPIRRFPCSPKPSRSVFQVRAPLALYRLAHTHSYPSFAANPSLRRSFMSDVCQSAILAALPSHVMLTYM